jgi:acetyl esterase/lipase
MGLRLMRGAMAAMTPIGAWRTLRSGALFETRRYGVRRHETLQLIHPDPCDPEREPIVYIHGGGWICGKKEFYTADLAFLTGRGHRIFNFDYPLAPEHPFPIPLISLVHGLAWLRRTYHVESIHLMGDSAGGNLALMLGLLLFDRSLLADIDPDLETLALPEVRSVISLYGVLDRLSWLKNGFPGARLMLHCYGGRVAFEQEIGPEQQLAPMDLAFDSAPPCFLAAGTRDPLGESSQLALARLKEIAPMARLELYEGEQHGFFNMGWRDASQRLRDDIALFLDDLASQGRTADSADDTETRPAP